MRVLGLIVEYNPFHNGHLYHLEQSKLASGAEYTVCVMSGNFIQRGEPAIVNKWARARMALQSGIDLVIELPYPYAMSSAEYFAYGAVKILDSLGVVGHICFGSEHGSIRELDSIAGVLFSEPEDYRSLLKEHLDKGLSYPSAREQALTGYFDTPHGPTADLEPIIGSPNNILGIEYLKALKRIGSSIVPLTINRIYNEYNSCELTGSVSSATSIRNSLQGGSNNLLNKDLLKTLPEPSLHILKEEFESGRGPVFSRDFESIILAGLRKTAPGELSRLPYISEGLENRIINSAEVSGGLDELVEGISTKRYTRTRIQRILFNSMVGMTASEFDDFNNFGGPQYIRVLGFNQKGRRLLSQINKNASLPVIIKTADYKRSCNPLLNRMLEIESLATDLYVLGYKNPAFRKAGQEFTQNVIR